jgi:hypothetical protein
MPRLSPLAAQVQHLRVSFRDAGARDFCQRPHAGPLHYERLGWGSFRDFASHVENALRELGLDDVTLSLE